MKIVHIYLFVSCLCCLVVPWGNAQQKKAGMRDVFLYNRSAKTIKSDCREIMGRHDFAPHYECFDEIQNKRVLFDPGTDWTPFYYCRTCMRNKVDGVVKSDCLQFTSAKDGTQRYLYMNNKSGQYVVLDEQWQPLPPDDSQCQPVKFETKDDPIKHFEFAILSDLEESADAQKEGEE